MADAGDGSGYSSGTTDAGVGTSSEGMDVSAESLETGLESTETSNTELVSNEGEQELYDPGYDASEYETELLDFSYEADDPSSYIPDSEPHYNEDGEPVDDVPVVTDESFIVPSDNYNETGEWTIDWSSNAKNADAEGFDKDAPITNEVLPPDTIITRYGSERGRFGTDKGTEYSELSLPYDPKSQEYHEYRVIEPVSCKKGTVAENFGQKGKGTQYVFSDTFKEMSNPNNPNRTMERIK